MTDLILVCEDRFGLEVLQLLRTMNLPPARRSADFVPPYRVIGFVSEEADPFRGIDPGIPRLGSPAQHDNPAGVRYVLGVKTPAAKRRAVEVIERSGGTFETVCSPRMTPQHLTLGKGSVVFAYSAKAGLVVGDYATVIDAMLSCHAIGAYSTVTHFANLAGEGIGNDCLIEDHAFLPVGKHVGDGAVVHTGGVLVGNLKSGAQVAGVPARKTVTNR